MSLVTITEPSGKAVSLAEVKEQLVIDDSSHDTTLIRLASVAERMAEQVLGGYVSQRTVELQLDGFPDSEKLKLPTFPIQSVESLSYTDSAGSAQTLTEGTDFRAHLSGKAGYLVALNGWADTQEDTPDAVRVRMVVGHEDGQVPEYIRHAILLKAAELFERREEAIIGAAVTPSHNTFRSLLNLNRRHAL